MYVPAHFALDEQACLEHLAAMGAADLVTTGPDGPDATYVPLEFRPAGSVPADHPASADQLEPSSPALRSTRRSAEERPLAAHKTGPGSPTDRSADTSASEHSDEGGAPGRFGSLVGHLARNNPQAKGSVDGRALVIVHAGDHYVSPAPMPSAAEHGKVVPTWDYVTVHAFGRLVIHEDPEWIHEHLVALSDTHEQRWALPGERLWSVDQAPGEYVERMMRALVGVEVRIDRLVGKAKLSQNKLPGDVRAEIDALEKRGMSDMARLKREVSLPAAKRRAELLHDVGKRRTFRLSAKPES